MQIHLWHKRSPSNRIVPISSPCPTPHTQNRKHLFIDIVVIAVCGLVCGCDGPTAIRRWAINRADWLNGFLTLPNGIPSRDCIRNLLMALRPEAFQACFRDWIASAIATDDGGRPVSWPSPARPFGGPHDGPNGLGPLPIVSAWASEHGIALGQVRPKEKSTRSPPSPQLLKQIELQQDVDHDRCHGVPEGHRP